MKSEGPELDPLLHRLAECPPEFLDVAVSGNSDGADVLAIVCDTMRRLAPHRPPELQPDSLAHVGDGTPSHMTLIAVVCWLLSDEFLNHSPRQAALWKLLAPRSKLARLAKLVRPGQFVGDPDRREELVRTCLAELGLRPHGEAESQSADRLTTLDSEERVRVLHATAAAERRAREIREAMARRQAQDAASRYGE